MRVFLLGALPEVTLVALGPKVLDIQRAAFRHRYLVPLGPCVLIPTIRPQRNLAPWPTAFHAVGRGHKQVAPFFGGMRAAVCLDPSRPYLSACVPAVHAAVPRVETAAAALGAYSDLDRHSPGLL